MPGAAPHAFVDALATAAPATGQDGPATYSRNVSLSDGGVAGDAIDG